MDRIADLISVWAIHLWMINDSIIFVGPSNSEYFLIVWLWSEFTYSEASKSWQDISTLQLLRKDTELLASCISL